MGVDTPEPPGVGIPTMTKGIGSPVLATDWGTNIANLYEVIRTDCICNANCDCNAICACHNDCGCNYSDETIKTDIVYL